MREHQRETNFLRQCIRYDDTEERHRLEERITKIECEARCVRRAVWLMALLAALAMAGLGYAAVFTTEFALNVSQLTGRFLIKALCALGGGSLICLFVFLGLGAIFRNELDHRRQDCRRLALKVLESRLGPPGGFSPPTVAKEREMSVNRNGAVVPASKPTVFRNAD